MKSPDYALLNKTQIQPRIIVKKVGGSTEASCNFVGAARIVAERFD